MNRVNLYRLKSSAPEILLTCEHLLEWLEESGNSSLKVTEEVRQAIRLLNEAGVDFTELDNPTAEEIAMMLEADAEAEQDEAEGVILTDDVVWQELEDMIANSQNKSQRASV